jgi:FkbM family methyltransferase
MFNAIKRVCEKDVRFGTVVDVGCADGHFFLELLSRRLVPGAVPLNIDANHIYEDSLREVASVVGGYYRISAISDFQGKIEMTTAAHPYWASLRPMDDPYWDRINHLSKGKIEVPATTLDLLARELSLRPPFLLKLDVQGAEESALKGAQEMLADTHLVICEADLDDFNNIHSLLSAHGFALYDATQLNRGPDGGLGWFYPVYLNRKLDHLRPRAFWPESANAEVINVQAARRKQIREQTAKMLDEIRKGQRGLIARNALCSCGSGKKYKHCCGVHARA